MPQGNSSNASSVFLKGSNMRGRSSPVVRKPFVGRIVAAFDVRGYCFWGLVLIILNVGAHWVLDYRALLSLLTCSSKGSIVKSKCLCLRGHFARALRSSYKEGSALLDPHHKVIKLQCLWSARRWHLTCLPRLSWQGLPICRVSYGVMRGL